MLRHIADLEPRIAGNKKKSKLVVAAIQDENIFHAVLKARDRDYMDVTFVGNEKTIRQKAEEYNLDLKEISIIHKDDDFKAGEHAVKLGQANRFNHGGPRAVLAHFLLPFLQR